MSVTTWRTGKPAIMNTPPPGTEIIHAYKKLVHAEADSPATMPEEGASR
ncbi:MAG: hypothetical protein OXM00_09110 [Paracoccaceae bacterium]|nr:hypothetical protein [Nitrososphaerota archaeon]MDE2917373.1 hypothetical protein [Paracoccaceae bacterium]